MTYQTLSNTNVLWSHISSLRVALLALLCFKKTPLTSPIHFVIETQRKSVLKPKPFTTIGKTTDKSFSYMKEQNLFPLFLFLFLLTKE